MKIHAIPASHNCRRVLATANHLGLDFELVVPDMAAGALKEPSYLALNPNGKVPTLEDGDFKLWESNAIMQYLASQKPNDLWPENARTRADIARWQFWEANHISRGTGPLAFERVFKPMFLKKEADEAEVEKALATFNQFAPVLNGRLEGRDFLLGDLTLADFSVAADFTYAGPGRFPLDDYPHIQRWLAKLDGVDAWKKSAPQPG
jgi:glutathione S-transferase